MHKIRLSAAELDLVLSALAVTAPVGGGSAIFTLYRNLCAVTCSRASESTEAMLCENVIDAAVECGVVVRTN